MSEIEKLDHVLYEGHRVPIEYFFSADWKLLGVVCGVYGPKSTHPCIWCHADATDSFECHLKGERSDEQAHEFIGQKKHMGYKFSTLLSKIPRSNIIIDVLHMKIRVVGRIISLLVKKFCEMDGYNGKAFFDRERHRNLSRWFEFVTVDCKLKRSAIVYNPYNMGGITRDFNGDELFKLINHLNLPRDFLTSKIARWRNTCWRASTSFTHHCERLILRQCKEQQANGIRSLSAFFHDKRLHTYMLLESTYMSLRLLLET